jgi:hypothetical protein
MVIPVQVTLRNVGRLPQLVDDVREGAQALAQLHPSITFCGVTLRRVAQQADPEFEARIDIALPGRPEVSVTCPHGHDLSQVLDGAFRAAARAVQGLPLDASDPPLSQAM